MEPDELLQNGNPQLEDQLTHSDPNTEPDPFSSMQDQLDQLTTIARNTDTRAQRLEAENARLLAQMANQPVVQTPVQPNNDISDDELVNRLRSDDPRVQLAAQRELMRQEMRNTIAPVTRQVNEFSRDRQLESSLDAVLQAYPQLVPARAQFLQAVRQNLGPNGSADYNSVNLAVSAIVGNLALTNPGLLQQMNNPNPAPVTNTPAPINPARTQVVPPRTPSNRPMSTKPAGTTTLTETQKKLKSRMDPANKISDQMFLERFYAEGQSREYEVHDILRNDA